MKFKIILFSVFQPKRLQPVILISLLMGDIQTTTNDTLLVWTASCDYANTLLIGA